MKRMIFCLTAACLALASAWGPARACTTMIATPGATADGSMMVTHSDDNELGDQRLIFVPAKKQEGARRTFADYLRYPRIVTDDRGPAYNTPDAPTKPLIEIPYAEIWKLLGRKQETSFAYFDGDYGIMNEKNLMFGECTNGANYEPPANPVAGKGKPRRIFYSAELSRIALENCVTAREAVKLMGALIDEYGYFSTGETLLVGDEKEAWVFEMCALPDVKHHSAWVAQRVPDGQYFVAANTFRIRDVVKNDPDNFRYSRLLIPGLKKLGWWDEAKQGPVDWLRAVSPGEYNHPYYSLRRIWRCMDRVNPDLGLSPWVRDTYTRDYPFAIAPKDKLSAADVFALYRDHYEGTQFDLTKGAAAGPYGDPHRFVGPYDGNQNNVDKEKKYYGAWERAVSVFYQGYTYVCQTRPGAPEMTKGILWFGPDVAYTTVFTPFFSKMAQLPKPYQAGDPRRFDPACAWWHFDLLANWSRLNFQRMTRVDILPAQRELEELALAGAYAMDDAMAGKTPEQQRTLITQFSFDTAGMILNRWRDLTFALLAKYSDGYINRPGEDAVSAIGYPADWLNRTDYRNGPTTYDMK
ncbi:C69 family dipeptidase [Pseudodesulfovibrio sp.]|uniref:dipeptidase n=1 Tax=Pseudodesulfovibrio sp. TaxID=2035812 RepID=UPI0026202ABA|nr:C69 family dipeptidase [Pseudodesulfovibrio sp.]MDD3313725.1 C69 family dipeptidase [Pseudodesulfovibrio sp.]